MSEHAVQVNDIPAETEIQAEQPVYDGREQQQDLPLEQAAPQPGKDVEVVEAKLAKDPREDFVQNYRAQRDNEAAPRPPGDLDGEEPAPIEEPSPDGQPPRDNQPRFTVKVYGQERQVTQDELIRNYQMNEAAELRFAEANARVAEAKKLQEMALNQAPTNGNGGYAPNQPPEQDYSETQAPTQGDDQELRQFVESMQLGTTDEAVEAAKKLLNRNAAPQQAVDISGEVDRVIATRTDDARSTAAMDRFIQAFPILDDPAAVGALEEVSRVEMARDLAGLGLPLDKVLSLGLDQISDYHRAARLQGRPGFRSQEQILGNIARNPSFHALASSITQRPVNVQVDRSGRKAMVQQQPALRSSPPQQQTQDRSPEARASSVVAKMRADRGQTMYGA